MTIRQLAQKFADLLLVADEPTKDWLQPNRRAKGIDNIRSRAESHSGILRQGSDHWSQIQQDPCPTKSVLVYVI